MPALSKIRITAFFILFAFMANMMVPFFASYTPEQAGQKIARHMLGHNPAMHAAHHHDHHQDHGTDKHAHHHHMHHHTTESILISHNGSFKFGDVSELNHTNEANDSGDNGMHCPSCFFAAYHTSLLEAAPILPVFESFWKTEEFVLQQDKIALNFPLAHGFHTRAPPHLSA